MRWLILFIIAAGLAACDRKAKENKPVVTTSGRPAPSPSKLPATAPSTRPAVSSLVIDGKSWEFPTARLVLQHQEPTLSLLLFSDDPPEALSAGYSGNRYFLRLNVDVENVGQLELVEMNSKQSSVERIDAPDGIFLEGSKVVLQPRDWRVAFSKVGEKYAMHIDGMFMQFSNERAADPGVIKRVRVQGVLFAELELSEKEKKRAATRPAPRPAPQPAK